MTIETFFSNIFKAILSLLFMKFLFINGMLIIYNIPNFIIPIMGYPVVYFVSLALIPKKLKKEILNVTQWQVVLGISIYVTTALFLFNPQTYVDLYELYMADYGNNTDQSKFEMLQFIFGLIFIYTFSWIVALILLLKNNKNTSPTSNMTAKVHLFSFYVITSIFILNQIIYFIRNTLFETVAIDYFFVRILQSTTHSYTYGSFYHVMEGFLNWNLIANGAVLSFLLTILLILGILKYIIIPQFKNLNFEKIKINYFLFLLLLAGSMDGIDMFIIQLGLGINASYLSFSGFTIFTSSMIIVLIVYSKVITLRAENVK